jgi:hypothetical protein
MREGFAIYDWSEHGEMHAILNSEDAWREHMYPHTKNDVVRQCFVHTDASVCILVVDTWIESIGQSEIHCGQSKNNVKRDVVDNANPRFDEGFLSATQTMVLD